MKIKLTNINDPEENIRFKLDSTYYNYVVIDLFIYDEKSKKVIMSIGDLRCKEDVDSINLGIDQNSISFIKDYPILNLVSRRKVNFDGNMFFIPLGFRTNYKSKRVRGSKSYTNASQNSCSLYIPSKAFKFINFKGNYIKKENFEKIHAKRFKIGLTDVVSDKTYLFTGKCNFRSEPLNKNKEMVNELKDILKGVSNTRELKITNSWKENLINRLDTFVCHYSNYEIQD